MSSPTMSTVPFVLPLHDVVKVWTSERSPAPVFERTPYGSVDVVKLWNGVYKKTS